MSSESNVLNNLWVEKYRPRELKDLVLPDNFRNFFQKCIDEKSIPNLMFVGTAGTGKTTLARILIDKIIGTGREEREFDVLSLNGSASTSVDVARGLITDFIKMPVISDANIKIVHIDEADYTSNFQQAALRSIMEEYSNKCRFIFTLNFKHKMMEALFSRCQVFEFNQTISKDYIVNFISNIIKQELNETNKEDVIRVYVNKYFPDIRRTLNAIQSKVVNGQLIDEIVKTNKVEEEIIELIKQSCESFLNSNSKQMQNNLKQIETNLNSHDIDYMNLYSLLFDTDGISFSSKIIVSKYANQSHDALVPAMHFISMIYEILGVLKKKKNATNEK